MKYKTIGSVVAHVGSTLIDIAARAFRPISELLTTFRFVGLLRVAYRDASHTL